MARRATHRERGFDLWLALLAGDRAWRDGTDQPTSREQIVASALVVALVSTLVSQWIAISSRVTLGDGVTATERLLLGAGMASLAAAAALSMHPFRLARGHDVEHAPFWWSVAWRGIAYLVLVTASAGVLIRFRFLAVIPLGVVAGADILLALWALGISPQPIRWLRRFLFSTVHFGVLGALLATAILEGEKVTTLVSLYVAMWVGGAVATGSMVVLDRANAALDRQRSAEREAIRAVERSYRAHWLHDDVLSEVRVATLRMGDDPAGDRARQELLELDHRLRLRQLDEMMRGGPTHIYQLLQPHLRRAQALGVELRRVPSLEVTGLMVDAESGKLVNRALSVLTSNAINAGARSLAVDLRHLGDRDVEFVVTDDAGGFDLAAIPAGRGLDLLRRDLGDDALRIVPTPGGTAVAIRLSLSGTPPTAQTVTGQRSEGAP